jgi:hypothetical protein
MRTAKLKFAVFACLAGVVAIYGAMFWSVRESIRKGYSDFAIYYGAGSMVRQGLGHQLYNEAAQFKAQREFSPEVAIRLGALPYNHPPFEALLFVPFTYAPYPFAFLLWDAANLAMLISLPFLLRAHLPELQGYSWPLWILASLAFFPIFVTLLQGQDAILLLFLYSIAFVSMKKNRDSLAGVSLALGLFKPHLVLPFVLLLLVQGRKKILYGFLPVAALLTLVSVAIVGKEGLMSYPGYAVRLENTLARGAIVPSDMPNLRGLLSLFVPGAPQIIPAVLVISLGLLLFAALQCRRDNDNESLFDLKFSLAAIATILVSYHAMIYDLSFLMVPVFLLANELLAKDGFRGYRRSLAATAVAAFFIPPLLVLLSMSEYRSALLAWALLAWMWGIAAEILFRAAKKFELPKVGVTG